MLDNSQLPQTLIILSGLPGCGKTTMAQRLVKALQIPILTIDDVVDAIPQHLSQHSPMFWQDMVSILLHLVDSQLAWGQSVLVDSVFMGVDENHTQHQWSDRQRAFEIAQRYQVNFRPVYLYVSDEDVWQQRLTQRAAEIKDERVATWTQVSMQRHHFQPWQPGQALFVDNLNSIEDNFSQIMSFIANPDVQLAGWE